MRIGILGHFGGKEKFTDGQTVKTVMLYDALVRNHINNGIVDRVDTYYIKHNPFLFIWQLILCLLRDKKIIVLLSSNGRRVMFPILWFASRCFHKQVYHYAIGGRLANEVKNNRKWKKYIMSFAGNWMESTTLAAALREEGVSNACYLPNFKLLPELNENELPAVAATPFRFCTFSRVMPEKGITDAINAITEINRSFGRSIAALDVYGPVVAEYKEELERLTAASERMCNYCGIVSPEKSVEVVKKYYSMLFPTHWRHEGIPGTIIDALASGVPIIARRWQYCDEMITDHETGYVYEWEQPEKLRNCIEYAITHEYETMRMKKNCLSSSRKYSEQVVLTQICEKMGI